MGQLNLRVTGTVVAGESTLPSWKALYITGRLS